MTEIAPMASGASSCFGSSGASPSADLDGRAGGSASMFRRLKAEVTACWAGASCDRRVRWTSSTRTRVSAEGRTREERHQPLAE